VTAATRGKANIVCWTKMQAEAGQDIAQIVARKELERRAGNGIFFWGIGNAPSRSLKHLVREKHNIDVVFSLMKSRPKSIDASTNELFVWRTFFDLNGNETPLPNHALVTSRMKTSSGVKSTHYALICRASDSLSLNDYGSFDPSAYRNLSEVGGPIGHSQVTALIIRKAGESKNSGYRVNLRASLSGECWVKLGQPARLCTKKMGKFSTQYS